MIARPVASPPVKETRSTRGSVDRSAPAPGPATQHQVGDAGRKPGLVEQPHQVDRGVRGELARFQHERVPGGQTGSHLPRDLEQRVVPRRDQAAHADRLVHDPADHVGVAGVDHPARLLGRDPAVVAEDRDDVVDVVLGLDEALPGVERLHPRDGVLVADQQVGDPQQQVTALARRRRRPRAGVERPDGPLRSRRRCPRPTLRRPRPPARRPRGSESRVDHRQRQSATARRRRDPARALPSLTDAGVAYGASNSLHRNAGCS